MSIAHAMLAEFEHEAKTTRKFLERIPQDKLAWKTSRKIAYRRRAWRCTSPSCWKCGAVGTGG